MNATRRLTATVLLAVTPLLAAGCAKPPQEAIDQARTALDDARTAGAGDWAATEWGAAQEAMAAVDAELEKQSAKMAIGRSYKETERLLAEASSKVAEASAAAAANKEAARQAANAALEAAQQALTAAQTLATELEACPRKPKGFAADMELIKGSLQTLAQGIEPLGRSMDSEDYETVSTEAEALRAQVETLTSDMQAAKTKIGC